MDKTNIIEEHPLEPFIPINSKMLLLGSFPPPRERWSMDFYYPNLQNDMWRLFGYIFFDNADYFLTVTDEKKKKKIFSQPSIEAFLQQKGIAISDTARSVVRHKGNASDKFLEIIESIDLTCLLDRMPECRYIVTTGDKATQTLCSVTGGAEPPIGSSVKVQYHGREIHHYRMPSTSRAYPKPLPEKAEFYKTMFAETGLL